MGRIRILPENLTNKIAAGEVVERPASVVKELVENAVDAGATEVVVEIENGGKKLIRVTDSGSGMSKEDALLALERHATSKIRTDEDLFSLTTLGFRGEALPSVASVSRFTLASREKGALEGTEIYVEGGSVREVKACGMAEGTVVTVRNLFFNTPARLKFLKSVETEGGHVGDVVTRMALSRPDVRVTFRSDGKTVFRALNGSLLDRITALLGKNVGTALFPVEYDAPSVRVSGFVAAPDAARSTATQMFTFINGRYVRDKVVQHAITSAYRQVIERGRYPVVALFLQVLPAEVDVNVHPTKHEVRFRRQSEVHDGIVAAVETVLRGAPWQRGATRQVPVFPQKPAAVEQAAVVEQKAVSEEKVAQVREALERYRPQPEPRIAFPPPSAQRPVSPAPPVFVPPSKVLERVAETAPPREERGYFSSLAIIGQFRGAYILCQDDDDLVLIDQHAAHERVAFERLKRELAANGVEAQGLLFPETLDLSFSEVAVVRENQENLEKIGFGVEHFGGTTYLLQAVPRLLSSRAYLRAFRDIVEELASVGRNRTFQDLAEDVLARIACHSVVRGTHVLSVPEMRSLFASMDEMDFSGTCPHGRPVSRKLSLVEIERMFKRQ